MGHMRVPANDIHQPQREVSLVRWCAYGSMGKRREGALTGLAHTAQGLGKDAGRAFDPVTVLLRARDSPGTHMAHAPCTHCCAVLSLVKQ